MVFSYELIEVELVIATFRDTFWCKRTMYPHNEFSPILEDSASTAGCCANEPEKPQIKLLNIFELVGDKTDEWLVWSYLQQQDVDFVQIVDIPKPEETTALQLPNSTLFSK